MEYTREQLWRMKHHALELYETLKELVEVVDDKNYDIDSFTTQPAREALDKVEGK